MKIENKGAEFTITFDNKKFNIPSGPLEISSDDLAVFIVNKAKKWGYNVVKISNAIKPEVTKLEVTKDTVEPIKEEVIEVPVKEKKTTKNK